MSLDLAAGASYFGQLGYLAVVSDQAELDFLEKVLGARNAWLALTDIQQEGVWLVAAGPTIGQHVSASFWAPGDPSGGPRENCAVLSTTGEGLSDANCNEPHFFVIEYECQTVNTTSCERKLLLLCT